MDGGICEWMDGMIENTNMRNNWRVTESNEACLARAEKRVVKAVKVSGRKCLSPFKEHQLRLPSALLCVT